MMHLKKGYMNDMHKNEVNDGFLGMVRFGSGSEHQQAEMPKREGF